MRSPRDILKSLRAQASVNAIVRYAMRTALRAGTVFRREVVGRWPVGGEVQLESNEVHFRFHASCDDWLATYLYYGFPLETGELRTWSLLAKHSRCIFDVGANTGIYSIIAGKLSPTGRVFAFEPHPTNFDRLSHNLRLNELAGVRAICVALGDREGAISFTVPSDDAISLVASPVKEFSEAYFEISYKQIEVPQLTLDAFCEREAIDSIDLIKIDVESYEISVLRGASKMLESASPLILAEVFNPDVVTGNKPQLRGRMNPDTALEVEQFLFDLGYQAYAIGEFGLLRVRDLRSIPDGGSNYLFSKIEPSWSYAPHDEPARILELARFEPKQK